MITFKQYLKERKFPESDRKWVSGRVDKHLSKFKGDKAKAFAVFWNVRKKQKGIKEETLKEVNIWTKKTSGSRTNTYEYSYGKFKISIVHHHSGYHVKSTGNKGYMQVNVHMPRFYKKDKTDQVDLEIKILEEIEKRLISKLDQLLLNNEVRTIKFYASAHLDSFRTIRRNESEKEYWQKRKKVEDFNKLQQKKLSSFYRAYVEDIAKELKGKMHTNKDLFYIRFPKKRLKEETLEEGIPFGITAIGLALGMISGLGAELTGRYLYSKGGQKIENRIRKWWKERATPQQKSEVRKKIRKRKNKK